MKYDTKTSLNTYIIKIFLKDIKQWRYFEDYTSSEKDMKIVLADFLRNYSAGAFDSIEVKYELFGREEPTFKVMFDDSTEMLYSITTKN